MENRNTTNVTAVRQRGRVGRLLLWQWGLIAVLLAIGTIDYLDRSTLTIGNPLIRHDMGLSVVQMGWLLSAFSWSYALFLALTGIVVDRWGTKRMLGLGAGIWSLAQVAAGLVGSFSQFVVLRVLLGLGEAPFFPAGTSATAAWFQQRRRAAALGAWTSASALGPAIGAPLLTFIMLALGWRGMFIVMGAVSLVLTGVWMLVYRHPREAGLSDDELAQLDVGEDSERHSVNLASWLRLFRHAPTWGMMLGFFGSVYLTWVYLTWLPGYLEISRHVDIASAGALSTIPYGASFFGYVFGGLFTHWFERKGLSPVDSSRYIMIVGLLAMAVFTVPAALTSNLGVAVTFISLAEFFGGFPGSMCWAVAASVAPRAYIASLGSIQDFGGYIGGALAPTVTGYLVAGTGSFTSAFIVGAAIAVVSAFMYLLLVRRPIRAEELA